MADVLLCGQVPSDALVKILARYHLNIKWIEHDLPIPGSHFGDAEAGLIGNTVYVTTNTPVHSLLHESCHYICMDSERRAHLHTDAGGDYDEENAVCYLSILLAGQIPGFNADRMMADMDSWGYTFRLGSARHWFEQDADDARQWLQSHHLIDNSSTPTGKLRK